MVASQQWCLRQGGRGGDIDSNAEYTKREA
jgi:hypothetical protein